ncbi:MAG: DUF1428 domain-containing protein [Rhizobiales bacterium]|nr:DUF1428 domain-containing protein [Hyphomicrobiales bacterium]MBO6700004.1 DUF1428 domain-containing protein [Hyphomicrobiales bacterium]MBO6737831.1 DUF1428 domain-containing protein [Hyphomicrobiales bacterium]MBO6913112.1 DUF1428 domain-containing protein [Hyphomicrobiales bacterium]MBO6957092.1 DUF1428 domain-containing protein [Hyphomicrobiales bacterium]
MSYVDGFVFTVPTARKDDFRAQARALADVFREYGALSVCECWGVDVPDGEITSFPMAVKKAADETVVFSWIVWPDKATRDKGNADVFEDPRMEQQFTALPLDGKRMIMGGFEPIVAVGSAGPTAA